MMMYDGLAALGALTLAVIFVGIIFAAGMAFEKDVSRFDSMKDYWIDFFGLEEQQ